MRLRAIVASAATAGLAAPAEAAAPVHGTVSGDLLWTLITALCVVLTGAVLFAGLRLTLGVRAGADADATRHDGVAQGNGGRAA
jgi:hypothetical protein